MRSRAHASSRRIAGPLAILLLALATWIVSTPSFATDPDEEILALIEMVADSDCSFIRNGKRYPADRAAEHLRLKFRRGRKYADTPEHFIERLASKSSMSGKPYFMECDDEPRLETRRWLERALRTLRGG